MTFNELPLKEPLLKAVEEMGFTEPTPIQEQAIPGILESDRDLIGLAETGSGKTAAFGLPMLHRIDPEDRRVQGLVLAPTRELCMQITREMESFARHLEGVRLTPVYGGSPFPPQIKALKGGTHVIIATPGRLLDLINKGVAKLDALRFLVLDEADVMLNMGFKDELDAILEAAPAERQSLLLSATMPPEVARIASSYMNDPREITTGVKNRGTANVEHSCFMVHAKDKYKALKRLVDNRPGIYGIIFCRTRAGCQTIADKMMKEGYNTDSLHGDLSQAQRELVMKKFREKSLQLLVATDIAARGLDVNNLSHVIHYDLPDEIEVYNHRSGRTGRAGNKGHSYAIIHMKEKYRIRKIEKILGRTITYASVPTGREICEAQLLSFMDKVHDVTVDQEQISPYMESIAAKLDGLDREELISRFVSLEFNRFLSYYGKERDITAPGVRREGGYEKRERFGDKRGGGRNDFNGSSDGYAPLSISVGKKDGVLPQQIIGMINSNTPGPKPDIGKITIGPSSTIVSVDSRLVESVKAGLNRVSFKGRRLKVRILENRGSANRGTAHRGYANRGSAPSRGKAKYGGKKDYPGKRREN